jgi:hypothetical protein
MNNRKMKIMIVVSEANKSSNKFVILAALEELQKATFVCLSVCQSVRMEQLGF